MQIDSRHTQIRNKVTQNGKTAAAIFVLITLITGLSSCANKVEVPKDIRVSGEVTVRHEISISADMKALFHDQCSKEATQANIAPDFFDAYVDDCETAKEDAFIQAMMDFLEQEGGN